ncbi:MAG: MFS transporter [Dehalococcoidia bacterium]|nr:MFS transporter [Dehalococcoidia bacterium]
MPGRTAPQSPAATADAERGRRSRRLSMQTFSAFRLQAFRLLWVNTFTFALSQSIRQFTFVWLTLELTKSSAVLGAVSFALGVPVLLFSLPAGALADRVDRGALLFVSQAAALALSVLAAFLAWAGAMEIGLTIGLALVLGGTVAFGQPVRNAIVPSLVDSDRLLNAITLMSLGQNVSQIAGPAIAGGIIAFSGVGGAFAAQALLLGTGLVALLPLRVPRPVGRRGRLASELAEGFRFVRYHAGVRVLLALLVVTSLIMGGTFMTLMPKIAKDDFHSGALGTSLLFAAMGVGMLMSSLLLASFRNLSHPGRYFMLTLMVGGCLNTVIGLAPVYAIAFTFLFLTGWNAGFFSNLNLTLIQSQTPASVMGRVMSIYTICLAGVQPLGSLIAGLAADWVGAREWYVICGVVFGLVGFAAFVTQPSLRRMDAAPRSLLEREAEAEPRPA